MNDRELFNQFVTRRDEQAFAELVHRYINLVYRAALRQLRDPALAEDVTQKVFVQLANKARTIRPRESLAGWLLSATRFCSLELMRLESRRRRHESEAAAMKSEVAPIDESELQRITPMLDEAIGLLRPPDRDALAMRYFQDLSIHDVADAMGVSDAAAQKRLNRAVERLRAIFMKRGISLNADVALSALAAKSIATAPSTLSGRVIQTALSSGVPATTVKGTAILMAMTNTKLAASLAAILVVLAIGTPALIYLNRSRAATEGPKPIAVAQVVQTRQAEGPPAGDAGWEPKFNAVYGLAANENVKRIVPPYIPERSRVHQADPKLKDEQQSYLFSWNGSAAQWQMGTYGTHDFASVLKEVTGISAHETDIQRDLFKRNLAGDWVIREGLTPGEKVQGLCAAVPDIVGDGMTLKSEPVECEVILVGGTLDYKLPRRDKSNYKVLDIHRGAAPQGPHGAIWANNPTDALQIVGDALCRRIFARQNAKLDGDDARFMVQVYTSASFSRDPDVPSGEVVDEILANLSKQTSLEFKREKLIMPVWKLTKAD